MRMLGVDPVTGRKSPANSRTFERDVYDPQIQLLEVIPAFIAQVKALAVKKQGAFRGKLPTSFARDISDSLDRSGLGLLPTRADALNALVREADNRTRQETLQRWYRNEAKLI